LPVLLTCKRSLLCHVVYDSIRQTPLYEIELSTRRGQALKLNAFSTTKRVEEFLRVSVETGLVRHVDCKGATPISLVRDVSILCVVGDEPLQITQRNTLTLGRENVVKILRVARVLIEPRERLEEEVRPRTH